MPKGNKMSKEATEESIDGISEEEDVECEEKDDYFIDNKKVSPTTGRATKVSPITRTKKHQEQKSKPRSENVKQSNVKNGYFIYAVTVISVIILVVGVIWFRISTADNADNGCFLEEKLNSENKMCARQKHNCKVIKNSIQRFYKDPRGKVIILVLLAHSKHRQVAECLSLNILDLGRCVLNSTQGVFFTPRGLSFDTDEFIEKVQPLVQEYSSIVVDDLLEVNVNALIAMHTFCDVHNPLVSPAMYTFHIYTDEPFSNTNATRVVSALLRKKFNGKMGDSMVQPLITRITDGPILPIVPEYDFTGCNLSRNNFAVI